MPSLKRKDASSDEEDAFTSTTPGVRGASYEPRRSLSPAPSPKRRRCDVLESGMLQLTLEGRPIPPSPAHFAPGQLPPTYPNPAAGAPTVLFPLTPSNSTQSVASLWADGLQVTPVLPTTTTALQTSVVLPGSVEEPTSPEAAAGVAADADVQDVSMKVPSWYEIEKDRIVITDLEDSDAEDGDSDDASRRGSPAATDAPHFTISSVLLERLPRPSALGPPAPDPNPSNALVLYRPLPLPESSQVDRDADGNTPRWEGTTPRIEEVFREDEPIAEDMEMPVDDHIEFTPVVGSTGEPADEPMDIEML